MRKHNGPEPIDPRRLPRPGSPSTRATPTSRPPTPRVPGSSRGTTTKWTTTTPTIAPRSWIRRESFLARRAAAYQAYYEHMPLRRGAVPRGPAHAALHARRPSAASRSSTCSTTVSTAPTRCVRVRAGGGTNVVGDCPARLRFRPHRCSGRCRRPGCWAISSDRRARWNVLAQQTLMAQLDRQVGPGASVLDGRMGRLSGGSSAAAGRAGERSRLRIRW